MIYVRINGVLVDRYYTNASGLQSHYKPITKAQVGCVFAVSLGIAGVLTAGTGIPAYIAVAALGTGTYYSCTG
jgi:hypothetical protein